MLEAVRSPSRAYPLPSGDRERDGVRIEGLTANGCYSPLRPPCWPCRCWFGRTRAARRPPEPSPPWRRCRPRTPLRGGSGATEHPAGDRDRGSGCSDRHQQSRADRHCTPFNVGQHAHRMGSYKRLSPTPGPVCAPRQWPASRRSVCSTSTTATRSVHERGRRKDSDGNTVLLDTATFKELAELPSTIPITVSW